MMLRAVTISLLLLTAPAAFAQDATCEDQAGYVLNAMPGLTEQNGYGSASEFLENDTRLTVSSLAFASAADVLGERAVDRGLPRQYWLGLLVVSYGLIECFDDSTASLTEDQLGTLQQFNEIYPPEVRSDFAAQAMGELGMFGEDQ